MEVVLSVSVWSGSGTSGCAFVNAIFLSLPQVKLESLPTELHSTKAPMSSVACHSQRSHVLAGMLAKFVELSATDKNAAYIYFTESQ